MRYARPRLRPRNTLPSSSRNSTSSRWTAPSSTSSTVCRPRKPTSNVWQRHQPRKPHASRLKWKHVSARKPRNRRQNASARRRKKSRRQKWHVSSPKWKACSVSNPLFRPATNQRLRLHRKSTCSIPRALCLSSLCGGAKRAAPSP